MALRWVEVFAESAYGVRMLGYAHCVLMMLFARCDSTLLRKYNSKL